MVEPSFYVQHLDGALVAYTEAGEPITGIPATVLVAWAELPTSLVVTLHAERPQVEYQTGRPASDLSY